MFFYPYAAPALTSVAWASDAVRTALMGAGLVLSVTLAILALRSGRKRVVHVASTSETVSIRAELPRAAA
jgi:hypothetical protein